MGIIDRYSGPETMKPACERHKKKLQQLSSPRETAARIPTKGRPMADASRVRQGPVRLGCTCAIPTAAGSPQARPIRRCAAVARQPQPPGRRSHRRRPDTSGRRKPGRCSPSPGWRFGHPGTPRHGAAVLVDGLGAERHHRTDRGQLLQALPGCVAVGTLVGLGGRKGGVQGG